MKTTKILFGILTITAALTIQSQAQALLTDGLVAYYPFNGNTLDASGYGNNLTNHGAVLCPDRFGSANRAYHFDGVTNYMFSSSPSSPLPSGSADRTLSIWVKADAVATNDGTFVAIDTGNANNNYNATFGLLLQGKNWGVHFVGAGNDVFSGIQPDVSWHQFVCVYSSGNVQLFMDGIQYVNMSKSISTASGDIIVGAFWDGTSLFSGVIDDIRVYNRAFSSNEVAQLYVSESTPIAPPYVELKFDLKLSSQNTSNVVDGVATIKSPEKMKLTTKDLLNVLAADEYAAGNYSSDSFPKHAALALAGSSFVVVDGTNILVNVSDIMSFSKGQPSIISGKQNIVTGLAAKKAESLQIAGIMFNDTFIEGGSGLKFYINGTLNTTITDSTPVNGAYTETQTIQLDNAAGDGWSNDVPFICTGSVSGKGKSSMSLSQ